MADAILSVELQAKINNFLAGMRSAATESNKTAGIVEKSTNRISSAVTSNLAGIFSTAAIIGFGKAVLDVTAEFQKFNAVLSNTLGSAALANLKIKEIQDFAAKTPFGVQELTASFVKLANSGFKPTGDQMRQLGDLASSTGKSFDQLAEAILDAQSGEFERLKEFGIRAKDAGDSVIFTYKGVQTQVEKTSSSIRDYITALGDSQGVSGSMAKISETLGGQISNLGDNWDQMLLSVGGNTEGVFKESIGFISAAVSKMTEFNRELEVASKYKVGNGLTDFFETLYKYSAAGIVSGAPQTTRENMVGIITDTQDAVAKYASKAISAAKSTADFGKALDGLKKKGDEVLKNFSNPAIVKGISDAYQLGVKAIQDARNNFNTQATGGDANFGTGKTAKGVKTLSDILKELDQNLQVVSVQFLSTFSERNDAKIKTLQTAIDAATKSFGAQSKAVQDLIAQQQKLFQLPSIKTGSTNVGGLAPVNTVKVGGKEDTSFGANLSDASNELTIEYAKILDNQNKFNADFQKGFENLQSASIAEAIGGGFSAIGEAMVSGGNIIEAAGSALLGTLSGFLKELGGMLVKKGLATVLAGTALNFLFPGSGAKTTAGGFALIAAGAALSLGSGVISGIGGKGTSSTNNNSNVTAFANGGIISGPTLGLMGEYSGAKTNPEVVAPLNKLKSMLGDNSPQFEVIQYIEGDKLAVMVRNSNKRLNRI